MNVQFVAGFGPIVRDMAENLALYQDALGLPLEGEPSHMYTRQLAGVKAFALWTLADAAKSCFGAEEWPADLLVPQGWLEFDVDDVATATAELEAKGYRMLVANRLEPWGQTVSRLLGPDGLLIGITYTPFLREDGA